MFRLLLLGNSAGGFKRKWKIYFRDDFLPWLVHALPGKLSAQNFVGVQQPLPGCLHAANINRFREMNNNLLNIDAGMRFLQMVEEHPLLHRGERIGIDQNLLAHRLWVTSSLTGGRGNTPVCVATPEPLAPANGMTKMCNPVTNGEIS